VIEGKVKPLVMPRLKKRISTSGHRKYIHGLRKEKNRDLQFDGNFFFKHWAYSLQE